MKITKICTNKIPSHAEASKILQQLKTNPEVCDDCKIKPCTYALFLYGKKEIK